MADEGEGQLVSWDGDVLEAVSTWIREATLLIRDIDPPNDSWPEWRRHDEATFILTAGDEQEWTIPIHANWEALKTLASFQACIDHLDKDDWVHHQLGSLVGDALSARRLDADDVMLVVLHRAMCHAADGMANEELRHVIIQWLSELKSHDARRVCIAGLPAFGFTYEGPPIEIGEAILGPLEDEEIAALLSSGLMFGFADAGGFLAGVGRGLGVCCRYATDRVARRPETALDMEPNEAAQTARSSLEGANSEVLKAISAMRLLKPGRVSASGPIDVCWSVFGGSTRSGNLFTRHSPFADYELLEGEIADLLAIRATLVALDQAGGQRAVKLALRRFEGSYDRADPEDRIVNQVYCRGQRFLQPEWPGRSISNVLVDGAAVGRYRMRARVAWMGRTSLKTSRSGGCFEARITGASRYRATDRLAD